MNKTGTTRMRKRAPGRPRQEESSNLTEMILDRASRYFSSHGFNGTTVEKLAIDCGVTRRSIMSRFKSKDEILIEVARRDTSRFSGQLDTIHIREESVLEDLRAVCLKLWERGLSAEEAGLLRCYLGEVGRLEELSEMLTAFTYHLSQEFECRIRQAQRFGKFPDYEASIIGTCAVAMVISHARIMMMLGDDEFVAHENAYFDRFWNFILRMA